MKTLYENEEKNRDSSMFENPGEVEKKFYYSNKQVYGK